MCTRVTFSVGMKWYAGTYKIHYHINCLCSECSMYLCTFLHKVYVQTHVVSDICSKEIACCSACSSLQPCSGSHESCAVRTQVARPAGEHGILYHNREEVCWLHSVFSQFSCKLLSGIHVPSFTSHAEKKQSLQLPWRREELVSSYVISMCNQLHYGIVFLCEGWH